MSWVVEVGEQRHHRCNDFYRVFITIDLFAQHTYGIYLNLVINIQYLSIYIYFANCLAYFRPVILLFLTFISDEC